MLMAQHAAWIKKPSPHFIAMPDEKDMNTWVILVVNLADQFEYGEYLFTFTAGENFPHKPPENLVCHTPNGVFETGGKICISIGEFHGEHKPGDVGRNDLWRPSLGLPGFAENIANSMVCYHELKGGVRIVNEFSPSAMKMHARRSREYNHKNNGRLSTIIELAIAEHPNLEPVKQMLQGRIKHAEYGQTGNTAQGAPANPTDISTPFVSAGARNASLSFTPMSAAAPFIQVSPPAVHMPQGTGGLPAMGIYKIPGWNGGSPPQSREPGFNANGVANGTTNGASAYQVAPTIPTAQPEKPTTAFHMGRMGGIVGSMGAGGMAMGTIFPSAVAPTSGTAGGHALHFPGAMPAGASYAGNAAPATYAQTVSAYQAPPPVPTPNQTQFSMRSNAAPNALSYSDLSPPTASIAAAYVHSTRHVGVSSGHSVHAQAHAAATSGTHDSDPSFPKVAFSPQQTFHLHSTTTTTTGAYSARLASFAEAAAAAEEKAGGPLAGRTVRIAGQVELPPPMPAFIEPPIAKKKIPVKQTTGQPMNSASVNAAIPSAPTPSVQRAGTIPLPQKTGAASFPQRAGTVLPPQRAGTVPAPQIATSPVNSTPVPSAYVTSLIKAATAYEQSAGPATVFTTSPPPPVESSSGPLFPGGMPALAGGYAASSMAMYGLKPVAASPPAPILTSSPSSASISAKLEQKSKSNSMTPPIPQGPAPTISSRHDNVANDEPNNFPEAIGIARIELHHEQIKVVPPASAVPAVTKDTNKAPANDDLSDEIDSLLLGDDDAITAAINAVNASFDEPPSDTHERSTETSQQYASIEETTEVPSDKPVAPPAASTMDTLIDSLLED